MSFGRALARGLPRARRLSVSRPRFALSSRRLRLVLLATIVVGALLLGGWLWLRDSSLVAVTRVTVSGVSGPDASAIRSSLVGAARGMTTLDVNMSQLRTAVASYPAVADIRVSTQFPHGMRIRVIERPPVAVASVGGRRIAVAGDGTLLHDASTSWPLPVVPLAVPPGGPRLTGIPLEEVRLLAAAPAQVLAKVGQVTTMPSHGLVAQMRGGPNVYFGQASSARAQWIAASTVLADPGSAGAAYIDVTDPVRPAAGAGAKAAAGAGTQTQAAAGTESASAGAGSSTPGG